MIPPDTGPHPNEIRALFAVEVSDEVRAEIADAYAALGQERGGRGALVGDGRGPRRGEFRRTAGHLPQRPRRRGAAGAVRRCWASLWTARAMSYRARQGIDPATVRLAVVVQRWSRPTPPG